jgi:hypothetical protein
MELDAELIDNKKAASVPHLRLTARMSFKVYFAGCVVTGIILIWSAVANGALQRQHSLQEWLLLAAFYVVCAGLWPIALLAFALMYVGIVHGPIEVPNPFL